MKNIRLYLFAVVLIVIAASCASADGNICDPGKAKAMAPGSACLVGGYVTATFSDYNAFVIESDKLSSAITITPYDGGLQIGDKLIVSGTVQDDGTLAMDGLTILEEPIVLSPLVLSNREITGLVGNPGLATKDLLVYTTGRVIDVPAVFADGSTRFHIADGSAVSGGPTALVQDSVDGEPREVPGTAIQVVVPPSVGLAQQVNLGDNVIVVGIVGKGSTVKGKLCSIIIRDTSDLTDAGGSTFGAAGSNKKDKGAPPSGVITPLANLITPVSPQRRFFPVLVIAADNTGDYGPGTAGTVTDGWQEAITFARGNHFDVYVKGGKDNNTEAVFSIGNTITIPAGSDFRIDGGSYTMNWTGATSNKDMILMDSQMNCRFYFDKLVHNGGLAALRIKPVNNVPDGFPCIVECDIRVNSITGPGNTNYGVIFDTSTTGITGNDFYFGDISAFGTAITTPGSGGSMQYNRVRINHLHATASSTYLMRIQGTQTSQNRFEIGSIACDNSATSVVGVEVAGVRNQFNIGVRGLFNPAANTVKLLSAAARNQFLLTEPAGVPDWRVLVTDSATDYSNEFTSNGATLPMFTQTPGASPYNYYEKLYPAVARVVGGTVSALRLYRGSTYRTYGTASPREPIYMSVGDRLYVTYSGTAPTVQIIPLKAGL